MARIADVSPTMLPATQRVFASPEVPFASTPLRAVGLRVPVTFSTDGPLPQGLSLDSATGVISGTPHQSLSGSVFRVVATGADGKTLTGEVQTTGTGSFTDVAAGSGHALALDVNGTVFAWGRNDWGQLGDGSTAARSEPFVVPLPQGVRAISVAAGGRHSLAATSDGDVYSWGRNASGQLGVGTENSSRAPVKVRLPVGVKAVQVVAADEASYALTSQGDVYAWGNNDGGQLGDGTYAERMTPVKAQRGAIPGAHGSCGFAPRTSPPSLRPPTGACSAGAARSL